MKQFELGKRHKLCGAVAVDRLFTAGDSHSALCYPLRGVWRNASRRVEGDAPFKFVVTVPKKRLRHAVDRVTMRRRIREAYRLIHGKIEATAAEDAPADIAFVYVADRIVSSKAVHAAMERLLGKIHNVKRAENADNSAENADSIAENSENAR